MSKEVYKCYCEKCANRNIVEEKYFSLAFGIIDKSYCSNCKKVIFENHPKCETEIYYKNYKELKMNKELTPLEALEKIKQITSTVEQGFSIKLKDDPYYENELRVIETALKALDIIKECFEVDNDDFLEYDGKYYFYGNDILKEEYDLLKEVLL